jgi:sulfide:quinone oxidoreductase
VTTNILVVGGGSGGTMTANNLTMKLYPEIVGGKAKITMLSDSPWHYYKPGSLYVAFSRFFENELRRKQRNLLRPEIDFRVDAVDNFEFASSRVQGRSGKWYDYDYLVVSTGCLPAPERIDGLQEGGDHFYDYQSPLRLADKLQTIEKGRILITVSFPKTPNVPHQCGIAPPETTLMVDNLLRHRGVRDKVEIVYTYPTVAQTVRGGLFLQETTSKVMPSIFDSMGIKYERNFTLDRVDPEAKVAYSEEGTDHNFDILMATPPIRAVDAVVSSGISAAMDDEGWLPTDPETLKVKGLTNVYVLGDTVDLRISKAGGAVHQQTPVVVDNIASEIRIGRPTAAYDGRVTAIAQMGLENGMPLWYDYEHEVQPTPPNKLGSLMRASFNRGGYWAVVRGLI